MSADRPESGIEIVAAARRLATFDRLPVHTGPSFEILIDPATGDLAIHCLRCSGVSFNFTDIGELYCGSCHLFHDQRRRLMLKRPQAAHPADYLRNLNRVLHSEGITPIGAYCLGVVESILRQRLGAMPDEAVMQRAVQCTGVKEAVDFAHEWCRTRGGLS